MSKPVGLGEARAGDKVIHVYAVGNGEHRYTVRTVRAAGPKNLEVEGAVYLRKSGQSARKPGRGKLVSPTPEALELVAREAERLRKANLVRDEERRDYLDELSRKAGRAVVWLKTTPADVVMDKVPHSWLAELCDSLQLSD